MLDAVQACEALNSHGQAAEIDPEGQRTQQFEQGHGRWQVNGEHFEVHPGYLSKRSRTPDVIVIQGKTGWSATELDAAEQAVTKLQVDIRAGGGARLGDSMGEMLQTLKFGIESTACVRGCVVDAQIRNRRQPPPDTASMPAMFAIQRSKQSVDRTRHKCDTFARVPLQNCMYCGDMPSYHDGRCCPYKRDSTQIKKMTDPICDICRSRALVPFRFCMYFWDRPSYHHGRCCPALNTTDADANREPG